MIINTNRFTSFKEYLEDIKNHDYVRFDKGIIEKINKNHIVDIFRDIIEKDKIKVEFEKEERNIYKFKPKSLSKELYGTPDLFFIIMKMNNITHPGEMDLKTPIFVMNQKNVSELVGAIRELNAVLEN